MYPVYMLMIFGLFLVWCYKISMFSFSFKDFFFLTWTIFKVFIEFVAVLLPFYVLGFDHEPRGILVP